MINETQKYVCWQALHLVNITCVTLNQSKNICKANMIKRKNSILSVMSYLATSRRHSITVAFLLFLTLTVSFSRAERYQDSCKENNRFFTTSCPIETFTQNCNTDTVNLTVERITLLLLIWEALCSSGGRETYYHVGGLRHYPPG
jgi:hypothetical protein